MESFDSRPSVFGLILSTHRDKDLGPDADSYFQHENVIAAISVLFFRTTVCFKNEPLPLKLFFSLLLASLTFYRRSSYELIAAVELFSYAVPYILFCSRTKGKDHSTSRRNDAMFRLLSIAASATLSLLLSHLAATGKLSMALSLITPKFVVTGLEWVFPIEELASAHDILTAFAHPEVLQKQLNNILFVTFHIQIGMGFLGIHFLRKEQDRRNQLVRMDMGASDGSAEDDGSKGKAESTMMKRSNEFRKAAAPYIFFTALPYMFQIIVYGCINKFVFQCLQDDLHRTVRLNELFDHDNHLIAMARDSPTPPEAYAASMDTVVTTAYDLINRKLFSLPKVLLLPTVMTKAPMLLIQVFPFIFLSDWLKASAVALMTTSIENLQKQIADLNSIRSKVESFDIKNAELLQRSGLGATQFTQRRWQELTEKIQERQVVSDILSRTKGFFAFMQRNFIFSALIDCALANLIAIGKIISSDIFVFSRAIEDAVDMALTRSRAEAELARMMTEIEKLAKLRDIWRDSKDRNLLKCNVAAAGEHHKNVVLRNLVYSRGTAHARADHIELEPGVYALTGSNGSGKSTLFRLLMSCNTNEKSIDLHSSIQLLSPIEGLTEEDDLRRETACEASDETTEAEEEMTEVSVTMNGELDVKTESIPSSVGDTKNNMQHCAHRLSITMPSSSVIEISQTFYWPLYSRPIDWIYQEHVLETCTSTQLEEKAQKIARQLRELEFFQAAMETANGEADNVTLSATPEDDMEKQIISELLEEKEDWFSDLSGGQKSKVELVRKVFLHEHCPDVLLVDETLAPLDPASKVLVMAKIKQFCADSIVIVIYHTDVGRGKEVEGKEVECVPSNDFFDKNIHLDKGIIHVRATC